MKDVTARGFGVSACSCTRRVCAPLHWHGVQDADCHDAGVPDSLALAAPQNRSKYLHPYVKFLQNLLSCHALLRQDVARAVCVHRLSDL